MNDSQPSPGARVHVVVVPGFAGFDAVGQLEYYANLTRVFRESCLEAGCHASLHYFDNFPTAAVATRADRLARYLRKRMARGEFQDGDRIALVGHSTGGLDIRRLLVDLASPPLGATEVDGAVGAGVGVKNEKLLGMIRCVVFLSVPQWGTNIANAVDACSVAQGAAIAELRAAVASSQHPPLDVVPTLVAWGAGELTHSALFAAVRDALRECDVARGAGLAGVRSAEAHEAHAQLALWLRHMAADGSVVKDLRAAPPTGSESPAHYDRKRREAEIGAWGARLAVRTYATLAPPPARIAPSPECPGRADRVYAACHCACACGPFSVPSPLASARCLDDTHRERLDALLGGRCLQASDNDGIVNTASMLWPPTASAILVPGDHMDIVGHYACQRAARDAPREFVSYDLLASGSGFARPDFVLVWNDVFAFCCGQSPQQLDGGRPVMLAGAPQASVVAGG